MRTHLQPPSHQSKGAPKATGKGWPDRHQPPAALVAFFSLLSCLKNICGKTLQNEECLSGKLEKELGEENNLARKEELKDTSVPILVQNSLGCCSEHLLTNSPALNELALQTVAGGRLFLVKACTTATLS